MKQRREIRQTHNHVSAALLPCQIIPIENRTIALQIGFNLCNTLPTLCKSLLLASLVALRPTKWRVGAQLSPARHGTRITDCPNGLAIVWRRYESQVPNQESPTPGLLPLISDVWSLFLHRTCKNPKWR